MRIGIFTNVFERATLAERLEAVRAFGGAGALAALLFLPNLVWQAQHGWPTLTFTRNLRARTGGQNLAAFIPVQLGSVTIAGTAVWAAGVRAVVRDAAWRSMRLWGRRSFPAWPAVAV